MPWTRPMGARDWSGYAGQMDRRSRAIGTEAAKRRKGISAMKPAKRNDHLDDRKVDDNPANRDAITGEPGSHPVGSGLGAAGGGAAGAALGGAVGGPVGALIGILAGGVAGGLAGKGVAEKIDPSVEEDYWRQHYRGQPYVEENEAFEAYDPAYRVGYMGYGLLRDTKMTYDDAEPHLRDEYERNRQEHHVEWDRGRHAARDAWHRVEKADPRESKHE